jgi:choice-of-anchor A domain-containing protein
MPSGYNISQLTIAPGGSLTLYLGPGAGGSAIAIAGNTIINEEGLAQNLIIYCTPSVTSLSFSGNAAFTGVIVAPNANVTMNGSGSTASDYTGALMCNTVTMNGHFNFHYDVALSRVPSPGRWIANSWQEISAPPF